MLVESQRLVIFEESTRTVRKKSNHIVIKVGSEKTELETLKGGSRSKVRHEGI